MEVGLVTTTFPISPDLATRGFVARLAEELAQNIGVQVMTPAGPVPPVVEEHSRYRVETFRYAPSGLQILAHAPGGIPVALGMRPWLYFLLPLFFTAMFIAVIRLARRVDVVHANWALNGVVAGAAARICGKPVITTLRGSDMERIDTSRIHRSVLRMCLATNDRVVGVSDAISRAVIKAVPGAAGMVVTIPNGVDDDFLQIERRDAEPEKQLTVVAIGSLISRKAPEIIVRGFARAAADNIQLTVVGDGPERQSLLRLAAELGVTSRVRLIGEVPHDEIAARLADADIFVLASRFEGRPNAVLEAMGSGLPVVATRIPGVTELIEHERTGLLFDPGDVEALATHIRRLSEDAVLRKRLGAAARTFIKEQGLNWKGSASRYLALYREVLKHERSGS